MSKWTACVWCYVACNMLPHRVILFEQPHQMSKWVIRFLFPSGLVPRDGQCLPWVPLLIRSRAQMRSPVLWLHMWCSICNIMPDPMSSDFIWDALSTSSCLKGFIYYSFNLNQGLANFFCKGADSTYVSPIDRMVSVTTTQPCLCSTKAAIDDMETNGCGRVSFELYLQSWMTSQIWPACYNFPTPWNNVPTPHCF